MGYNAHAQTTITIGTGTGFNDATVYRDLRPGYSHLMDANYENSATLSAMAWTHSSSNTFRRTFLYFDLSQIPFGATINSAKLYLYSDPTVTSPSAGNGNSSLSGSNAIYLEKITSEWHPSTVTWNNQPTTTTSGRAWKGASTSTIENIQVSLTSIIQGWVNDPLSNYGLRMALENELHYRARHYASTNHTNAAIRPKLVITYTDNPSLISEGCGTTELTEEESMALPWYGNDAFLNNFYDSLVNALDGDPTLTRTTNQHINDSWLRIPLKFWIYRESVTVRGGGDRLPNERGVQRWVDFVNESFNNNGIRISFYLLDAEYVNEPDAIRMEGFVKKNRITKEYDEPIAINVHVVDFLDNDTRGGEYAPNYNGVFVIRRTSNNMSAASVLAHELGHFFGLNHTHYFKGVPCFREPVTRGLTLSLCPNRINGLPTCLFTGDFLCDTEADPNMLDYGTYDRASCTWNGNGKKDYRGDTFKPNSLNVMAYANAGDGDETCRTYFSPSQKKAVYYKAFGTNQSLLWRPFDENRFDAFEPDNGINASREITLGETQNHTFHSFITTDNVDMLRFAYPNDGSLRNYRIQVTNIDANAVGVVEIREIGTETDINDDLVLALGPVLPGITSTINGNITTYTIPCNALTDGDDFAIVVNRGTGTGTRDYSIRLFEDFGASVAPTLTGPSRICSGNNTYSISNLPTGVTVVWTKSNNLTQVSTTNTGNTYVVKPNGVSSGTANVTATITSACGQLALSTNALSIGYPFFSSHLSGPTVLPLGQEGWYVAPAIPGVSNYTWTIPFGWTILSTYVDSEIVSANLRAGGNLGLQAVSVTTANINCGSNRSTYQYVEVTEDCEGVGSPTLQQLSPNPTDSELEIALAPDPPCDNLIQTGRLSTQEETFSYKIFNHKQMERMSGTIKGLNGKVDTRLLPNGIYIIHIYTQNTVIMERFLVMR